MRIERRFRDPVGTGEIRARLNEAAVPAGIQGRICGETCTTRCHSCGSSSCQCRCRSTCPDAPRALSSDPEAWPIEHGIVPLVFEMKRLDVFVPCWSCEGHTGPGGAIDKLPRVWFYAWSLVHLRLLANGLASLKFARRLKASWQIAVTYSDPDNPDTAFSLEPVLPPDSKLSLTELQADAAVIAWELNAMMRGEAMALLDAMPCASARPEGT